MRQSWRTVNYVAINGLHIFLLQQNNWPIFVIMFQCFKAGFQVKLAFDMSEQQVSDEENLRSAKDESDGEEIVGVGAPIVDPQLIQDRSQDCCGDERIDDDEVLLHVRE